MSNPRFYSNIKNIVWIHWYIIIKEEKRNYYLKNTIDDKLNQFVRFHHSYFCFFIENHLSSILLLSYHELPTFIFFWNWFNLFKSTNWSFDSISYILSTLKDNHDCQQSTHTLSRTLVFSSILSVWWYNM